MNAFSELTDLITLITIIVVPMVVWFVGIPIGQSVADYIRRRTERETATGQRALHEIIERLAAIEAGVAATAVEVERLGEMHRALQRGAPLVPPQQSRAITPVRHITPH
jgi:hypothetical protein